MRSRRYDGTDVRRILVGMATNDKVVNRISSQWSSSNGNIGGGLFESKWANLVGSWCCRYAAKYGHAPGRELVSIFEQWATDTVEEDEVVSAVEHFLQALSDQQDSDSNGEFNEDHLIDLAGRHFNRVRIKHEIEQVRIDIDNGMDDEAWDRINQIRKVEIGERSYVEPCIDYSVWHQAFEIDRSRPLVRYPGDLGLYFANSLLRGEFYAFMGPDKSGKTVYQLDLAWRACRMRKRTAFFDCGDSDEDAILQRLSRRAARRPEVNQLTKLPTGWDKDGTVVFDEEQLPAATPDYAYKRFKRTCKDRNLFRLVCYPNSTLTVNEIEQTLDNWHKDGWTADVVVVDYADILAPPQGVRDVLEGIDEIWKGLRRMSQRRHCLVVTATQSNAAAYGKEKKLLSRGNFSGRKTKLAHVDGMVGINVSTDERQDHCARLNWVVRRKWKGHARRACVHVAGCHDLENPVVISRF